MKSFLFFVCFFAAAGLAAGFSEMSFGHHKWEDKWGRAARSLSEGRIGEANKILKSADRAAAQSARKICLTNALRQMTGEIEDFNSSCLTEDQRGLLLLLAAERGDTEAVRKHLAEGADPNTQDKMGRAALYAGAEYPEAAELLLEAGADPNIQSWNGETALHEAAYGGINTKTVALLLAAGADPNIQDEAGNTALHDAAYGRGVATPALLLAAGADKKITNRWGKTAFDLAVQNENNEVASRLAE